MQGGSGFPPEWGWTKSSKPRPDLQGRRLVHRQPATKRATHAAVGRVLLSVFAKTRNTPERNGRPPPRKGHKPP